MEHLDGVCEQAAVAGLIVTWTDCVPENGAMCMALRGTSGSTMLDWAGKQESTIYTMVQLKF